jgi:capsule polysaccharide export protein KpsC/LpsZ
LFSARQNATLWENFSRLWQGNASEGGEAIREKLGLDQRPVVLLATNVLGDSLTLGRNLFSKTMAQWVARTVQYFVGRPDVQFIVRIHPGELITEGLAMADIIRDVIPVLPEHIHMIEPGEKINTYDIVEIATLGLVFTTTVGLEMAMCGKPVIVAGDTHYRGRGFTFDPDSWVNYYKTLGRILQRPQDQWLTEEQVELAWRYAYSFFFEYPLPYPWHLVGVWGDYKDMSLADIFSEKNYQLYQPTFEYLAGRKIDWSRRIADLSEG